MNQEILFAQTIERVKKIAKEQGNCIPKKQVEEEFAPLKLDEEKLNMVFDYLKQQKIGIDEPVNLDDYLSEREADYLSEYLRTLEDLPDVSEGEQEAVTLSAMAGDADAQNMLIKIFLPRVVEFAKLYTGQGVMLEDLIGEGNVAVSVGVSMLGAFENASNAQGALGKMIMDAMEEAIAENADNAQKDRRIADKVNKVADKANELAGELHRKVTVEELMEESGMSRKVILDAMRISADKIDSIQK